MRTIHSFRPWPTLAANSIEITVKHEERFAGESKYSLYQLIRLNFDLVTGFSIMPLQIFSILGMLLSLASLPTFWFAVLYSALKLKASSPSSH
jgi:undecaprenyl-phosphate 4-deoxy-4-formamido-L-arabinose transferase